MAQKWQKMRDAIRGDFEERTNVERECKALDGRAQIRPKNRFEKQNTNAIVKNSRRRCGGAGCAVWRRSTSLVAKPETRAQVLDQIPMTGAKDARMPKDQNVSPQSSQTPSATTRLRNGQS